MLNFLTRLAPEPELYSAWLRDPQAAMKLHGLDDKSQKALCSGVALQVHRAISAQAAADEKATEEWMRRTPPSRLPPSSNRSPRVALWLGNCCCQSLMSSSSCERERPAAEPARQPEARPRATPETSLIIARGKTRTMSSSEEQPFPERPEERGSLTTVGTGVRIIGELTVEAIAHMQAADKLACTRISDPIAEHVVEGVNRSAAPMDASTTTRRTNARHRPMSRK